MPYTPKYQLAAEGLIIDNVLKIVKDNFKPALDVLYPAEALLAATDPSFLPDLTERTFGSFMRLGFPALVADLVDGEDEDSEARVDESVSIEMLLVVTDVDGSNVTRRLTKYVRALRVVLMSAPWTAYMLNVPSGQVMPFTLKLTRKYLPVGKGKDDTAVYGYMRPAELRLTLQFGER